MRFVDTESDANFTFTMFFGDFAIGTRSKISRRATE